MNITSKLESVSTSIFSVMSALANKHGAINLSQGFPNFDCDRQLKELVTHYMHQGFNQYAPMPGILPLRNILSQKVKSLYDVSIDPKEEITITAGATQAIYTIISAFVRHGDEVIIIEPAYDSYGPSIELMGGIVKPYSLKGPDFKIDWAAIAAMTGSKTKMIVFNNPHNPTGKILSAADLLQLQKITDGTDILVLSDEVYEHLVFDGKSHESVLKYPALFKRSLLTFSFGKTFHSTGWKVGYCIAPAPLMKEFRKVHQYNVFSVNHPVQHALAEYLKEASHYLGLNSFFQKKRDVFLEHMRGSRFMPIESQGTYFQLFDYSAISDLKDTEFAEWLTETHGVASIPISPFYSQPIQERVVRFCFAKTEDVLKSAAEILKQV